MKYENLTATVGEDGWSRWVHPWTHRYRTSCCDCGLVHDMQFFVDRQRNVYVRFKRNNRATAAIRRRKKNR